MVDCQCTKRVRLGRDEPTVHNMRWQIKYFHFTVYGEGYVDKMKG